MKKVFVYLAGVATGVLLTFAGALVMTRLTSSSDDGLQLFEKEGQCMDNSSFRVIQVLETGDALANSYLGADTVSLFTPSIIVLLLNDNGEVYYDDQVVEVPEGKCAKQVGVFKYQTRIGEYKTVPAVSIRRQ